MITLDNALLSVLEKSSSCSINWGFSFLLMYLTGCRHEEIDPVHWSDFDESLLQLNCVKNSEIRFVSKDLLGSDLVDILLGRSYVQLVLSRSTLSRAFMYSLFPYRIIKGDSNVFLHSFRYNFVKKVFLDTMDIEATRSAIGHKDVKNTSLYVTSTLKIIKL
jgi:hypothetical protein